MERVRFSEILADYRAEKLAEDLVGDWGSVVFYRLPAFAVASAAARLGMTPNQLTAAGTLLIPVIALAAWFLPPSAAMLAITLVAVVFNVFDCADGSLARATGQTSLRGRYMDFAADILYRNTAYASYGLVADRIWPGASFPWLAVGLVCGSLVTYVRVNRIYAAKLFPTPQADPAGPQKRSAFDIGFSALSGLDTLMPMIAFLAWTVDLLWLAMLWFLLYTLADAVIEVVGNVAKARHFDSAADGAVGLGRERGKPQLTQGVHNSPSVE